MALLALGSSSSLASGQNIITTVAGSDHCFSGDGGPAVQAQLCEPHAIAALPDGSFLMAGDARIRKVNRLGIVETVAGTGESGFSGDGGPAVNAHLSELKQIAVSPNGRSFWILDENRVREVDSEGIIRTVAGEESALENQAIVDGARPVATLRRGRELKGLAASPRGGFWVADQNRVYLVVGTDVYAAAGRDNDNPMPGTAAEDRCLFGFRPARSRCKHAFRAELNIQAIAPLPEDGFGFLVLAEDGVHTVYDNDTIETIVGGGDRRLTYQETSAQPPEVGNHTRTERRIGTEFNFEGVVLRGFRRPSDREYLSTHGIAALSQFHGGFVFGGSNAVYRVDRGGLLSSIPGTEAPVQPHSIAALSDGALLIAQGLCVRKVDTQGQITTVAGQYEPRGGSRFSLPEDTAATRVLLRDDSHFPGAHGVVALPGAGILFVSHSHLIRRVDAAGNLTTVAGAGGTTTFTQDGVPATQARFDAMWVAARIRDRHGAGLLTSGMSHVVDRITPGGMIKTIAGTGDPSYRVADSGDGGPATQAKLGEVRAIAARTDGGVLIAEPNRVRLIDPPGMTGSRQIIRTVAGTAENGFSGDGGPAIQAKLEQILGLAALPANEFLIVSGTRIRKVASDGSISTVAGTHQNGFSPDGTPAAEASFDHLGGIGVMSDGRSYLLAERSRIRKVDRDGRISTVAGTGEASVFSGDNGLATDAALGTVTSLDVLPSDDFLITARNSDGVSRVRLITNGDYTRVRGEILPTELDSATQELNEAEDELSRGTDDLEAALRERRDAVTEAKEAHLEAREVADQTAELRAARRDAENAREQIGWADRDIQKARLQQEFARREIDQANLDLRSARALLQEFPRFTSLAEMRSMWDENEQARESRQLERHRRVEMSFETRLSRASRDAQRRQRAADRAERAQDRQAGYQPE